MLPMAISRGSGLRSGSQLMQLLMFEPRPLIDYSYFIGSEETEWGEKDESQAPFLPDMGYVKASLFRTTLGPGVL